MSVHDCKLIELPKISDSRGSLSFLEAQKHIPFDIKRVYYLYDLDSQSERGGHAHIDLEQFIICLSGSFDLHLDDGMVKRVYSLNKPWEGVCLPRMMWREMKNFSSSTVLLVLASDFYNEGDYIRDYNHFLSSVSKG